MITISLCMIVKDEEKVIARCLSSIEDIVDEIVIVDTGSTDNTKDVIKAFNKVKLFDFEWINDFSEARNYAFSKATMEYTFWLDADDVLYEEDRLLLKQIKNELNSDIDYVSMYYSLGEDESGNPSLIYRRNRLVKTNRNFKWIGFIHEYLEVNGIGYDSEIKIHHHKVKNSGKRNLEAYEIRINSGMKLSIRDKVYYAKELYYNGLYDSTLIALEQALKEDLWIEDRYDLTAKLADTYLKLNQTEVAKKILLNSFEIGPIRAELVSILADIYLSENKLEQARYFYESILNLEIPKTSGFIQRDKYNYYIFLQLCYIYFLLGDVDKSFYYNEKAAVYVPNHSSVIYNRNYFKSIGYGN